MRFRSLLLRLAPFLVLSLLLASSACPRGGGGEAGHGNIVLITVESLRSNRLLGPVPAPDPLANIRALAGPDRILPVLAASSETLPAIATLLTGVGPAHHGVLVEGMDRLPERVPTLASRFAAAGYRTAGFPSLTSLGLSSGLSRGFQAYGWSPNDLVVQGALAQTDGSGWRADVGRRPGQATAADALKWASAHQKEPLFLWIHLSEAAAPYATDKALVDSYLGNTYDAALAYDDAVVKAIVDGFASLGLADRTSFIVAGDHGESLGEHGESFHGLNLYKPALETVVALIPPHAAGGFSIASKPGLRGRQEDIPLMMLAMAGIEAKDLAGALRSPNKGSFAPPAISAERPLLAVTLSPRSVYGWNGRILFTDGEWAWSGPADEELYRLDAEPENPAPPPPAEDSRRQAMRARAMKEAAPIASRVAGRAQQPPPADRAQVVELMRSAKAAADAQNASRQMSDVKQAWRIDPGNYQTALWLAHMNGSKAAAENGEILREGRTRGGDLADAAVTASRIMDVTPGLGDAVETLEKACALGGPGCTVELALRLAHATKFEDAARVLGPVAEKEKDPDIWRTLGDLGLAVENTYRAEQALDKAAALRPDDPDIMIRQGDCLLALRDFDGAAAKFEAARRVVPASPLVEMRLGRLASQKGDRAAAVEHFRKGLPVDTNTAAGAIALGKLLAENDLNDEAVKLFHDAAARDTRSAEPYYLAASALAAQDRIDAAEQDLRSALTRDPNDPNVLYQLARLLVFKGDRDAAAQMLERLAQHANAEIAVTALRDPLFKTDAPGAPLAKGLQALYAVVKAAMPEGGALVVPASPGEGAAGTGSGAPATRPKP